MWNQLHYCAADQGISSLSSSMYSSHSTQDNDRGCSTGRRSSAHLVKCQTKVVVIGENDLGSGG